MKSVLKNYLYNSSYQILLIMIPLLTAPYLSRVVGAEGIGKYSYAYSVAYYFQMFILLGLNNYGNRTIASVREDKEELSHTFWNIYFMQFVFGILCMAVYILYTLFLSKDTCAAWILLLFVLSGAFDVNWFFNGLEKFRLTVIRNAIIKILATLMIFIFVKSSEDVYKYILIMSCSFLLSQMVIWPFVKKEVYFTKVSLKGVGKHIKPNCFLFVAVLAVSFYRYMDKIMLGAMVSESEVGYYENAEKLMQIPVNLVNALGIVMIPRMANIFSTGNHRKESNDMILVSEMFVMFLTSALCLGVIAVADVFVPVFFGEGFEKCITLLQILMPSCLFMAFANVIRTQYLIPLQKDKIYITTIGSGAVINLIANLFLIPYYKAVGAAIATLIAEITVCILQVYVVRKKVPIRECMIFSAPFCMSGSLMLLIIKALPIDFTNDMLELFIKIIVGIVAYFMILAIIMFLYRKKYKNIIKSIKPNSWREW